jgi:hypothetical protein
MWRKLTVLSVRIHIFRLISVLQCGVCFIEANAPTSERIQLTAEDF